MALASLLTVVSWPTNVKYEIFSQERQFLQGAVGLHCGRFCWTTQRLQQHLAYIPKKLGFNPCFQALTAQARQVPYEAVSFPKHVQGLTRRESLPTLGPQTEQITVLTQKTSGLAAGAGGM